MATPRSFAGVNFGGESLRAFWSALTRERSSKSGDQSPHSKKRVLKGITGDVGKVTKNYLKENYFSLKVRAI
jgi:hypothetical protein